MFVVENEAEYAGWVPESIDTVPPGCVLGAMLDDIDIDQCSGYDRVRVLRAHQKMQSHYAARTYWAMTSVVDAMEDDPDDATYAEQSAATEVRAALRLTRRTADHELAFALDLQRRLPLVWGALCEGRIDARRARVLVNSTIHLSQAGAQGVVDSIIDDAGLLTTGQLAAKLRKLCIEINPDDARDRYERSAEDRRVIAEPTDAGTTNLLGLDLPPHRVAAGMRRVNRLARALKRDGEERTIDQLRADVFLDIFEGAAQTASTGRGEVNIHTALDTLTRLANHPGELAGYGPVIADIARQTAEHQTQAQWNYVVNDPKTGKPIDTGIVRRRPTAGQRRHIQLRDTTCVFPGCRMPAADCDIDHRTPWAETHRTDTHDLAPLCRHDHNKNKHRFGWRYKILPDGDYLWTSPLGHRYRSGGRSP